MLKLKIKLKVCKEIRKKCKGKIRKLYKKKDIIKIDYP